LAPFTCEWSAICFKPWHASYFTTLETPKAGPEFFTWWLKKASP
jgi:hypothetical protein